MDIESAQPQKQNSSNSEAIQPENAQQKPATHKHKTKKAVKFAMHSLPYVNYKPQQVESLAYDDKSKLVAVARENCQVDIYKYPQWNHLHQIRVDKECPIRKILWVQNDDGETQLLLAHLTGLVTIYNMTNLKAMVQKNIGTAAIWSASVNPKNQNSISFTFDDGNVHICKYEDEDFYISKSLKQFQERALCQSYDYDNNKLLYVGYDEGFIRKHDIKEGIIPWTTTLDKKDVIWSLQSTKGKNLVVGTNNGNIFILETKFGVVSKEIQTHEADITTLAYNPFLNIVYATGSDSKIITLEQTMTGTQMTKDAEIVWVISSQDRGQSHDIMALDLIDNGNKLISGGVTTDICIYDLDDGRFPERKQKLLNEGADQSHKDKKLRHITHLPLPNTVQMSQQGNLVAKTQGSSLEVWKFEQGQMKYSFMFEIKTQSAQIQSFDIAQNGKYLAYSTNEETVIYKIESKTLKISKIASDENIMTCMKFNGKSTKLYGISSENHLTIFDLNKTLISEEDFVGSNSMANFYDIQRSNSSAIAFGSRIANQIFVYDDQTNQIQEIDVVQKAQAHYTCFNFISDAYLVVVYEDNTFNICDWKSNSLVEWSSKQDLVYPGNYLSKHNRIVGILPNPVNETEFALYTNYYYIKIHLNEEIPKSCKITKDGVVTGKQNGSNFEIVYFKKPVIKLCHLTELELLSIGYDWKQFTESLPPAINAKKYGH